MENDIQVSVTFDEDHPTLEGHFPGDPIIPGVVILNHVIKSAEEKWPKQAASTSYQVASCKFLKPLIPPAVMTIHLEQLESKKIKFTTRQDNVDLSSGIIALS